MKQHPLPQNITSYQFHLIGSMTLKQFLFLGSGLAGAWIFWSLPILSIFKWPLLLLSILIGVLFAFIPYQDRPLDEWLANFIKAIYSPTKFTWVKNPLPPDFLKAATDKTLHLPSIPPSTPPLNKNLSGYLKSLPHHSNQSPLDIKEDQFLNQIDRLFTQVPPSHLPNPKPLSFSQPSPAEIKIKIRRLKKPPPPAPPPDNTSTKPLPTPPPSPSPSPLPPKNISYPPNQPKPIKPPTPSTQATLNPSLPFPSTPITPNILVGMTLDKKRNILEGAIIEVKDSGGHPVRALKSNKLGQFYIATPLPNGTYEIETEKDGYRFNSSRITLSGNIINPIEIRALS